MTSSSRASRRRKDLTGRFTYANKSFCEEYGKSREQVIGKTDYDISPAEFAEKYQRDDSLVLTTGQTLRVNEETSRLSEVREVEVTKIPIHDEHGNIVGTQGIFWDMTAWKRAQADQHARQKGSS